MNSLKWMLMMLLCNNTNEFKIFGDGTDRIILVSGGIGYVINNSFLTEMSIIQDYHHYVDLDGHITHIPRDLSSELHFKCGKVEIIEGNNLEKYINPLMNKSVLDLMQIVNQKLKERK